MVAGDVPNGITPKVLDLIMTKNKNTDQSGASCTPQQESDARVIVNAFEIISLQNEYCISSTMCLNLKLATVPEGMRGSLHVTVTLKF